MRSPKSQLQGICPHFTFSAKWNKRDKVLHGHPACQKQRHSLQNKDWNIWALVSANIYPIDWKVDWKWTSCNGASLCFHSGEGLRANIQPAINENTEHWVSLKKKYPLKKRNHVLSTMDDIVLFLFLFLLSFQKVGNNHESYRKSSIKPPGGLIYFKPIWGGCLI